MDLFYTFVTAPDDIKDFVSYARARMMEDDRWTDYKKIVDAIDSDAEQYEAAAVEMGEKADAMDNEKISTYCMSKATLLGYLKGATELILLYQDMFDAFAEMAGMPRSFDEEGNAFYEEENAPDIQLMARFGGGSELPS